VHRVHTEYNKEAKAESRSRKQGDRKHDEEYRDSSIKEDHNHEYIAWSKDQKDRDRNHDERCQINFIDRKEEHKDRDNSRSSSRNNESRFRDRGIHDGSSRSKSG